jgi:hypothetical protein
MYFDWKNEHNVNELRRLVELDVHYPDIARKLKTTVGSVCAKVHRLGIGKGQRVPQPSLYYRPATAKFATDPNYPKIMARQETEAAEFEGRTVALEDCHDKGCHYVIGDPTKRQVCGRPRARGHFCAQHAKVCFPSPTSRIGKERGRRAGPSPVFGSITYAVDSRSFEVIDGGRKDQGGAGLRHPAPA